MSNHSELSRKEQVLQYLRDRANQWVDGPELANERVGGSEGLKRLRELRAEGCDIRMRQHPDPERDIWQYRLVTTTGAEQPELNGPRPASAAGHLQGRPVVVTVDPSDPPVYPRHEPRLPQATPRIGEAMRRKEDGTWEYVPPHLRIGAQIALPDPADDTARSTATGAAAVHQQTDQGGLWDGRAVPPLQGQDQAHGRD